MSLALACFCNYKYWVEIEWDPGKDAANRAKHGLSLADACRFEMTEALVMVDERYDYGEVRYQAFGRVDGQGRCLVFTFRDRVVRVISFRPARDKEMRRYGL